MNPDTCGVISPPPTPCTIRASAIQVAPSAAPQAALDTVKSTTPAVKTMRRERASPSRPAGTSAIPKASE